MDHTFSVLYQLSLYLLTRPYINPMCFSSIVTAAYNINFCIHQDSIFTFAHLELYFTLVFTILLPEVAGNAWCYYLHQWILFSSSFQQCSSTEVIGRRLEVKTKAGLGKLLSRIFPLQFIAGWLDSSTEGYSYCQTFSTLLSWCW